MFVLIVGICFLIEVDRLNGKELLVTGAFGLVAFGKPSFPEELDKMVLIVPDLIMLADVLVDVSGVLRYAGT